MLGYMKIVNMWLNEVWYSPVKPLTYGHHWWWSQWKCWRLLQQLCQSCWGWQRNPPDSQECHLLLLGYWYRLLERQIGMLFPYLILKYNHPDLWVRCMLLLTVSTMAITHKVYIVISMITLSSVIHGGIEDSNWSSYFSFNYFSTNFCWCAILHKFHFVRLSGPPYGHHVIIKDYHSGWGSNQVHSRAGCSKEDWESFIKFNNVIVLNKDVWTLDATGSGEGERDVTNWSVVITSCENDCSIIIKSMWIISKFKHTCSISRFIPQCSQ